MPDKRPTLVSQSTDPVDPDSSTVTRTDGRTDGLTKKDSPTAESSPNASRAGGADESHSDDAPHDHQPHVYVLYWPAIATIKVGISEHVRWEAWFRRGAVPIAVGHVCCMDFARKIERRLLGILAEYGARAFRSQEHARFALGRDKGGYTECYRLVQSPRFGETPEDDYDFERAYGLILPAKFTDALDQYPIWLQTVEEWSA